MDIVCSTDDNYIKYCCVMLRNRGRVVACILAGIYISIIWI